MRSRAWPLAVLVGLFLVVGRAAQAGPLLGAADFQPSPARPVGWRGDWTGRFPGATPPVAWSRRVKGITTEIRYQADKPAAQKPGAGSTPLEYFTLKEWLVAGPFDAADPAKEIDKDFLGGEDKVQPAQGDKAGSATWKHLRADIATQSAHYHNEGTCGDLNVDFVCCFSNLPDSGTVKVNGCVLGKDDEKIKSSIGLVAASERSFYWRLTGLQNLEFFAAMYGLDRAGAKARIGELFDLFEITYQGKRFDSYSTGMQQKFGLMRSLLHDPQILLLDEPTKSLDYASGIGLRSFIKERLAGQQGKTVIFTTHRMDEAAGFADSFAILYNGRLSGSGSLEDLRKAAGGNPSSLGEIFMKLTQGGRSC